MAQNTFISIAEKSTGFVLRAVDFETVAPRGILLPPTAAPRRGGRESGVVLMHLTAAPG